MKRFTLFALIVLVLLSIVACQPAAAEPAAEPAVEEAVATEEAAAATEAPVAIAPAAGLEVTGSVTTPASYTMEDLQAMTVVEATVTHPSHGDEDVTGVSLVDLITAAQPAAEATTITFSASDGYTKDLDLAEVLACTSCLVAFEDDGTLSIAMPDFPSGAWVTMLTGIDIH